MRYNQIRKMDISNGDGIGVALFVQGCHFHCKNCHNSVTWDFNGGKEWTDSIEEKFINLADKSYISRISILGGEPLAEENRAAVAQIIKKICKKYGNSKKIWLWTGYEYENIKSSKDEDIQYILGVVNVLIDGLYIESLKDLSAEYRGSTNQRIIKCGEYNDN